MRHRLRWLAWPLAAAAILGCVFARSIWSTDERPHAREASPAPSIDSGSSLARVRRADLSTDLQLDGVTARADAPITVPDGLVAAIDVEAGRPVRRGDVVGSALPPEDARIEAERQVEDARSALAAAEGRWRDERALDPAASAKPIEVAGAERAVERAQQDRGRLIARRVDLRAPMDGTMRRGASGSWVVDAGRVVRADLEPLALLRVRAGFRSGTVVLETSAGKTGLPCASIEVVEPPPSPSSASSPSTGEASSVGEPEASTGSLVCHVGDSVDTVDGLPAILSIHVAYGMEVLVVPELAIRYDTAGRPFVLERRGARRPVRLGASNGILRAIAEGITEGAEVVVPSPIERRPG